MQPCNSSAVLTTRSHRSTFATFCFSLIWFSSRISIIRISVISSKNMAYRHYFFFNCCCSEILNTRSGVPVSCYKVEKSTCKIQDNNLLTTKPHFYLRTYVSVNLVALQSLKIYREKILERGNLPYHN